MTPHPPAQRNYLLEFCVPPLTLLCIYVVLAIPIPAAPPAERIIEPQKNERAANEYKEVAVEEPPVKFAPK